MEHFAYLRLTILECFIPTIIDMGAACLTSQAFKNLPSKYGEILILEHTKLLWTNRRVGRESCENLGKIT